MAKINIQEIILDVIGILIILLSLWAYFFMGFDFTECTIMGCVGLSLFVLKGSAIRKLVLGLIDKYIK